jgi:FkbM family methyltransferase
MIYSQNNEQEIILDFFKGEIGRFLDIGANDGKTLSNTHQLSLDGWSGNCIEPAPDAFARLTNLYKDNLKIDCYRVAIGLKTERKDFYKSGTHLKKGDTALLSTLQKSETTKWQKTTDFEIIKVDCFTWQDFYNTIQPIEFDFISIDAEGLDVMILRQMDLLKLGVKLICIEYNNDFMVQKQIDNICKYYGMHLIHKTYENLIYARH